MADKKRKLEAETILSKLVIDLNGHINFKSKMEQFRKLCNPHLPPAQLESKSFIDIMGKLRTRGKVTHNDVSLLKQLITTDFSDTAHKLICNAEKELKGCIAYYYSIVYIVNGHEFSKHKDKNQCLSLPRTYPTQFIIIQ